MYLCGCKISSQAPFCDGIACQKLIKGEEFKIKEDMLYLDEEGEHDEEHHQEEEDEDEGTIAEEHQQEAADANDTSVKEPEDKKKEQ